MAKFPQRSRTDTPVRAAVYTALLVAAGGCSVANAQSQQVTAAPTPAEKVQAAEAAEAASAAQTSTVTIALIETLVREGVISVEKAKALLENAEREAALARQRMTPPASSTARVPYVPDTVKSEMRAELHREIVEQAKTEHWIAPESLPDWLNRISLGGDFRLRSDNFFFDKENNFPYFPDPQAINDAGGVTTANGFPLINSTENRQRLRYRARVELTARIAPRVKAVFALASGDDNGPISTNKTFGDYLRKDAIWVDRAYVEAKPVTGVTFLGGRMPVPFHSTDLVWDPDLNFEGLALSGTYPFGTAAGPSTTLTLGAFPLHERSLYSDRWLLAGQLGGTVPIGPVSLRLSGAYYNFTDIQSRLNPPDGSRLNDYTKPMLLAQGNSLFNMRTDGLTTLAGLASAFRLVNVTTQADWRFGERMVVRLIGDYVRNIALDPAEVARLRGEAGVKPGKIGWHAKLLVGMDRIERRHDWQFAVAYKRLETDAVLDAFTDSDFGAYGGTDLKGFTVEGSYAVTQSTWLAFKYLSSDSISRPPFSSDVVLVDLNMRF